MLNDEFAELLLEHRMRQTKVRTRTGDLADSGFDVEHLNAR